MRIHIPTIITFNIMQVSVFCLTANEIEAEISGWNSDPNTQYHVQTDEGPERNFRFQTLNGQYRKEKRLADGTVIGTSAWMDNLGFVRSQDYIADSKGYRILKSKMIYMGKDKSVQNSISNNASTRSGILTRPRRPPNPFRQPELKDVTNNVIEVNTVRPKLVTVSSTASPRLNTAYLVPTTFRPRPFSLPTPAPYENVAADDDYSSPNTNYLSEYGYRTSYQPPPHRTLRISKPAFALMQRRKSAQSNRQVLSNARNPVTRDKGVSDEFEAPEYDGTHSTADGFQYYLKTHYHEEERQPFNGRLGSFGYVDPFGIRRVIYYKFDSTAGFLHKKNNRYVGFHAKPYDSAPDTRRIV